MNRIRSIWHHRRFLQSVIGKEFKLRYTQSLLGPLWLILEPLTLVLTLTVIFTVIGRQGPYGVPFPVFFYAALLPWNILKSALRDGVNAFVSDKSMMEKVAFPKEISILKKLFVYLIDFLLGLVSFIFILIYFKHQPNWNYLYLPFLVLMVLGVSGSMMFFTATFAVFIRDMTILCKTVASVLFWFTPIVFEFPFSGPARYIYYFNPIAGIIKVIRQIVVENNAPDFSLLLPATAWTLMVFPLGYYFFRRYERVFVDVV